jgi:hypothetical protein
MPPFDMNQAINRIVGELAAVQAFIQAGEAHLRVADDFGSRCSELAVRLRETAAALPPQEPPPEKTPVRVSVPEYRLQRATWLERSKDFLLCRRAIDVDGRILKAAPPRSVLATVADPRWPSHDATAPVETIVEVTEFVKVPLTPGSRRFRYAERRIRRRITVPRDALPQDAESLRRVQEAYQRRREELNREVRDIAGFIQKAASAVAAQEQQTRQLQADTAALTERVARLPVPPDAAGELRQTEERVRAIRQGLAVMEREIAANDDLLAQLKNQAKTVCPELTL